MAGLPGGGPSAGQDAVVSSDSIGYPAAGPEAPVADSAVKLPI